MSYEPTIWKKGDKVTSTKLNKIENGIQGNDIELANVAEDVSELKENFTELGSSIYDSFTPDFVSVENINGVTKNEGRNSGPGGNQIAVGVLTAYDTYWFVTNEDIDIWVDSLLLPSYFSISYGSDFSGATESGNTIYLNCTNATRVRKSENNLPTEANKLHIASGSVVAFTLNTGAVTNIYGISGETIKNVSKDFIYQVVKANYLRYVSGSGLDGSTERVEVYIPTASGYVRYDFLHAVSQSINSDVWRIGFAYHTDDSFNTDINLTTSGEWECAIHLSDRDDFSGGYAHGDEIMSDVAFIVDGELVDITTLTDMTAFTDLCIMEGSNLYDPADHQTIFAKHGSKHHFTKNGLAIRQAVKFTQNVTVSSAYLAMLPISKAVSDTVVPDNSFALMPTTSSGIRITSTSDVTIYKTDGKVKAEFSAPIDGQLDTNPNRITFMCIDNGSTVYNKCYFVSTLSNVAVTAGKIIKAEARYNFVVGV